MDINQVPVQHASVCVKCMEHEDDVAAYEILLLALAFIGPIVGILIGLFAGKRLLNK